MLCFARHRFEENIPKTNPQVSMAAATPPPSDVPGADGTAKPEKPSQKDEPPPGDDRK